MEVSKTYQDELPELKKNVKDTYYYFKENYDRFHEFRKFVFKSTLNDQDYSALNAVHKPIVEVNIIEAYISRLCGEFSKQEPSIIVMADDGLQIDSQVISIIENHIRHILFEMKSTGDEYNVYKDLLSGGFSVFEYTTDYANAMSFQQIIKVNRAEDPTLCGFDPLAKLPSKTDGRYAFKLYPKTKQEFQEEYSDFDISQLSFTRHVGEFSWSYRNDRDEILLICDYYTKKKKKKRIVQLSDGSVKTQEEYKEFIKEWEEKGNIAVAPVIIGKPRWTEIETICRYRFIENHILEYIETDYPCFPLIFVDGNSIMIRDYDSGQMYQMTRPYAYNAKGVQKLKNCAAQNLANELEMLVQHKFKVAKESLPDEQEYLRAYSDVQTANTLVYNAFMDNDPNKPVPAPQEITRPPIPAEITQTFTVTDQTLQAVLGSYDASLGINDNQLSGVAIVEGATQSNSAAMPYVVGLLHGLTALSNCIVDLLPKYYLTPRTIPMVNKDGSRGFQRINDKNNPQSIDINYDSNALQVKVEAGVSFAIQKNRALQQIIAMMQASPIFAQFMNAKGLPVLLDNFEIRGIDQLKEMATQFMQEMAQQQQMQQQMQQQALTNNPQVIKAKNEQIKLQLDAKQSETENQIKVAELSLQKQQLDNENLQMAIEMRDNKQKFMADITKADAEKTRATVDMAIKTLDMQHNHDLEKAKFIHEVHKTKKEHEMMENNN